MFPSDVSNYISYVCIVNDKTVSSVVLVLAGVAYTQHQPAAKTVDNTRSCSYSDMLLMMGEHIAHNM